MGRLVDPWHVPAVGWIEQEDRLRINDAIKHCSDTMIVYRQMSHRFLIYGVVNSGLGSFFIQKKCCQIYHRVIFLIFFKDVEMLVEKVNKQIIRHENAF